MNRIRALTEGYVEAFNARDIDKVASFIADGFELTDPDVTALTPKTAALDYINGLFASNETLSFIAHHIVVEGNSSVIHFTLTLREVVLDGVDLIKWEDDVMTSMHAYLTPRS